MMTTGRIALLVFLVTLFTLGAAAHTQGNTRDEGYYFNAAELYWGWWGELGDNVLAGHPQRSFTRASVDRWFGFNHEHPALMKTLFGMSWRLFHRCRCPSELGRHPVRYTHRHRTLELLDEQEAMRLPAQASVALMAMLVFLMGAEFARSRAAGVAAAVMTVCAPRLFFSAQLACFDAPTAAMWVLVVYCYWRSLEDRRWEWRTAVAFGLALATKHNAFFIPAILIPHWLWVKRHELRRWPLPRVFLWMLGLGFAVYFVCWPWLWFDTVTRFRDYVAFHLHHVYYNIEYLGVNYNKPPFPLSFPYVMIALTVPATTLLLALGGTACLVKDAVRDPKRDERATGLLVVLNAIYPMAILTVTRAPIFGATKHYLATIPYLALLAAYGLGALARALGDRRTLAAGLAALACAPSLAAAWRAHPYGLTDYNFLAGGPPGGADLGMNRQFWGYATRGVLPWIDSHAQPDAPVYWHDTNQDQLNMDVRLGLLRPDIRNTGLEEPGVRASDLALVIHEMHFRKYEYWIWDFYGTTRPAVVLTDEGVPIVTLYQRPGKGK